MYTYVHIYTNICVCLCVCVYPHRPVHRQGDGVWSSSSTSWGTALPNKIEIKILESQCPRTFNVSSHFARTFRNLMPAYCQWHWPLALSKNLKSQNPRICTFKATCRGLLRNTRQGVVAAWVARWKNREWPLSSMVAPLCSHPPCVRGSATFLTDRNKNFHKRMP